MRRTLLLRSAVLAVSIATGACNDSSGPIDVGGVVAKVHDEQLELMNSTTSPVFTFVIGQNAQAYTD